MNFDYTPKVKQLQARLLAFMDEHIYPNEHRFHEEIAANRAKGNAWIPLTLIEELKPKARAAGLWNLFLPHSPRAPEGLSNLEYAPLCEIMGRVHWAPEVFNCNAPDTGNMETIERYGTEAHKKEWLEPLLRGEIRSAFLMTEPAVTPRSIRPTSTPSSCRRIRLPPPSALTAKPLAARQQRSSSTAPRITNCRSARAATSPRSLN
jgi:acyl-CoA dehydrogenase